MNIRKKQIIVIAIIALGILALPIPNTTLHLGQSISCLSQGTGFNCEIDNQWHMTAVITHQEQSQANFAWLSNMWLKGQYWQPSCYFNCNGVTYSLDPTVLIVDGGRNFEQCKVFGSAGTGDGSTCTAADFAQYIGLSLSATTPLTTDDRASAGTPCKTTSVAIEIITGGLADAIGTVTAGAAGTTVTTTVAKTFTAAETDTAVQVSCLQTELDSGANNIIYAEGTFGPDTLVSGNTIAITWSIART